MAQAVRTFLQFSGSTEEVQTQRAFESEPRVGSSVEQQDTHCTETTLAVRSWVQIFVYH